MKPRVLFLDHVGVLGGAELALLDIAEDYRQTSEVVLFAEGPLGNALTSRGVKTRILAAAALNGVRRETATPPLASLADAAKLGLRVALASRRYDLLYANSQKAFIVACAASVLANRPLLWDLNDILEPEHFSTLNIWVAVTLANLFADRVITNSYASAKAFVRQGGDADKVHVVYNGIDPSPFISITDAQAAAARDDLGLSHVPLVGVFGRLSPWKGQHVLIDALTNAPGVHALLVGDALFGETEYASCLRTRAEQRGVADRTHFLGFRNDIPLLMRAVDLVVHTSTSAEPFGRVIVEGMLAGKPVVATRAGGATEILADGTGVLVAPDDVSALADAIRGLFYDSHRAHVLAESGRTRALQEFGIARMLDGFSRHIEAVTSHRNDRSLRRGLRWGTQTLLPGLKSAALARRGRTVMKAGL
jgi:glycosyltransferase involved in cell wall biosynthesis